LGLAAESAFLAPAAAFFLGVVVVFLALVTLAPVAGFLAEAGFLAAEVAAFLGLAAAFLAASPSL
jgi:hypothetical protein